MTLRRKCRRNADAGVSSQTTAIFPGIFAAEFSLKRTQTRGIGPPCAGRAVSRLRKIPLVSTGVRFRSSVTPAANSIYSSPTLVADPFEISFPRP
jgi:hypothetical protein